VLQQTPGHQEVQLAKASLGGWAPNAPGRQHAGSVALAAAALAAAALAAAALAGPECIAGAAPAQFAGVPTTPRAQCGHLPTVVLVVPWLASMSMAQSWHSGWSSVPSHLCVLQQTPGHQEVQLVKASLGRSQVHMCDMHVWVYAHSCTCACM